MKKLTLFLVFTFVSIIVFGQNRVYKQPYVLNNQAVNSFVMFSNQDSKDIKSDLEKYLNGLGKVNSPAKNTYRIEKMRLDRITDQAVNLEIIFQDVKNLNRIVFLFLNEQNQALSDKNMSEIEALRWLNDFEAYTLNNQEIRLAEKNVSFLTSEYNDAQKTVKKIEKSIENNLKEQEKLGKKLDQSPELMAKALADKEELVGQIYTQDSTEVDPKAKSELSKASEKKEKEISKIKKDAEKASSKLEKKETEFAELKDELFKAKKLLAATEIALDGAKVLYANLRK